jgi:tRNA A37 methylthiotransferase MiaB
MLRLTVFTENGFASLGLNGIESLMTALQPPADGLDAVQEINNDFLEKIKIMETYEVGFTDEFKEKFIETLTMNIGKQCLLVRNFWFINSKHPGTKRLMRLVELLNEGKSLEEAQTQSLEEAQTQKINKIINFLK